jgi:hypothetical protein
LQNEQLTLKERGLSQVAGYDVYVERCWARGLPGTDECVSLSLADNSAIRTAAMRSAILLGNGHMKMVSWDTGEDFANL